MACPPVCGDNPPSGLSYVQVDKHGITILYHLDLHECRPWHITRYFVGGITMSFVAISWLFFFFASIMASHYFGTKYVKYYHRKGCIVCSAKMDFGYCQNHLIEASRSVINIWQPVYIFLRNAVAQFVEADSSRLTRVAGLCH